MEVSMATGGARQGKPPTLGELGLLSEADLLRKLYSDTAWGKQYREEYSRRMLRDAYGDIHAWVVAPLKSRIAELRQEVEVLQNRLSVEDTGTTKSLNDLELYDLAGRMKKSGWQAEGMRNPQETLGWVKMAVEDGTTWRDVGKVPGATEAWEVTRKYFRRWQLSQQD